MKKAQIFIIIFCLSAVSALAQTSNVVKTDLSQTEIDRIIKKFTDNEITFRQALTEYVFNRDATFETLGMGGQITGVFHRKSFMTFTKEGRRIEKILYAPVATVPPGLVTPEDLEDLGGVTPFALEPKAISLYNILFIGKEKIDDLNLYVFDVTPKVIPNPKKTDQRLFTGRIWVDDQDLMIVKSKGKAVPETKENKFPVVETWRENVDGKYWFPSFASSDDELIFDDGYSLKIKLRVKFTDYKQGDVKITIEDADVEDEVKEQPKGNSKLPPPPVKKP